MTKFQNAIEPDSCWNKARDEENLFILLGRDSCASATIRHWAQLRVEAGKNKPNDVQILDALACATRIEQEGM